MFALLVALAVAGPVFPDPDATHLRRCQSLAAATDDLAAAALAVPVGAADQRRVVDSFRSPRSGGRIHKATDIMAPRGTPIFALDDGVVGQLRWNRLGGRVVEQLDVTGCVGFYYAHLDAYAPGLQNGDVVHRGDLLGFVGTSGNTGGAAHLHLGVYFLGDRPGVFSWDHPLNPYPLLVPRDDS
ncbi:MAG: M23 family metallopeptidase [Deltaproteobacteria bacterium]|nr:M23 family metallopeptidase [Deltaproteobacteria bacterium]